MKTLLPLLACLLVLTGCAHGYVITMNNGDQIRTPHKPHYDKDKGFYSYKDSSGRVSYVFAGRVKEVAPASMVSKEDAVFKPVSK